MGRRKILLSMIGDLRKRKLTFKKRRIGLLKKAIQLALLSGANIELKVYYQEDKSLMVYQSHENFSFS